MQRRTFVKAGAVSLLTPSVILGCGSEVAQPDEPATIPRKLEKFGLQLSTVTSLMLADFEGTLARVAQIGYRQVEFSAMGFLGRSVSEVQKLLTANNLEAPVGRITPKLPPEFFTLPREEGMKVYRERGRPEFFLENVAYSLESAVALKQKHLVLPALMPDAFKTLDQVKRNIELMNQAGELCGRDGVVFGYHNHNWEFVPVEGVVPYDLMLQQTDADKVNFQMDSYWVTKADGDLFAYLSKYPGRFATCHLKDIDAQGDFADVGHGLIDFPRFTREAVAQGAEYFFVERDNPPQPAQSIQRSYEYLQQMTF